LLWLLGRYLQACSKEKYWQPFALELGDTWGQLSKAGVRIGGSATSPRLRDPVEEKEAGRGNSQDDSVFAEIAARDGQEAGVPLAQYVDRGVARRLDPVIHSLNEQNERFAIGRVPSPEQSRQYYFLKLPLVVELQTCFRVSPETSSAVRAGLCYFHSFRFVALGLLASSASAISPSAFAAVASAASLAKLCFSLKHRSLFRSTAFFAMESTLDGGLLLVALLNWLLVHRPSRLLEHAAPLASLGMSLAVWGCYWRLCRERKHLDREKFDVYQYFLYLMLGYEVDDEEDTEVKSPSSQTGERQTELETEPREEL
jgi:hypothetical protein